MYKHILLPSEGSRLSRKAVKQGVAFAKSLGAKVTGLYANPGIPVEYLGIDAPMPQSVYDAESERERRFADKVLAEIAETARRAGVPCDRVSVESRSAAEAIVAAAKKRGCDLIFMASHGRHGISAVLLGSETTKVLTHSNIPVLVCR
jgi:nucleotide-binding universal stress UspA family protein